jgi:hypothetical protein
MASSGSFVLVSASPSSALRNVLTADWYLRMCWGGHVRVKVVAIDDIATGDLTEALKGECPILVIPYIIYSSRLLDITAAIHVTSPLPGSAEPARGGITLTENTGCYRGKQDPASSSEARRKEALRSK